MIWDFLKKKLGAKTAAEEPKPAAPQPRPQPEAAPAAQPAPSPEPQKKPEPKAQPPQEAKDPDAALEKEIEKDIARMEPGVASQLKDPAVRNKIMELAKKMLKDGVDIKSEKAVKKWIKEHPEAVGAEGQARVETFKREEPKVGRNDPCTCGSGKKYKKCCGK